MRQRRGVTLVELLTVITIIGLLIAILLPAMSVARESARATACRSNLREMGAGLHAHAARHNGPLCTGAFDWQRDGAVTEVGWVADLVKQGTVVGQMLCPSNPAKLSETYNDLLTADTTTFDACLDRLGTQPGTAPDGSPLVNPCRKIAGAYASGFPLPPGDPARVALVAKDILKAGYNTNYTPSWFLVRSALRLDDSGNLQPTAPCVASLKDRSSTLGPLSTSRSETSATSSAFIPLLACGKPAETLALEMPEHPAGSAMVKSMTNGPVLDTPAMQPPTFAAGTPRATWWARWNNETLQDYRAFGPVHRGSCNILFSDGSVRSYSDENDDGLLNNGFSASPATGFTHSEVELVEEEVYSKWSLRP